VDYLTFALVMLLAQFSPGPDMLLLLKNAVNHPLRAGLWTVAGIALGLTVHTTLALTGLSIIIRDSVTVARILGLCGGLYLGWLAWQLLAGVWRRPETHPDNGQTRPEKPLSSPAAFTQGLVTNLLNPKAAIFLFGVLAVYADPGSSALRRLAFAGIILGQAVVFWSLFVWLLKRPPVRGLYLSSERWLNLLFGLGLAAVAVTAILNAV
jgi:threonine/homoserine/homoserine lactone efflux protein